MPPSAAKSIAAIWSDHARCACQASAAAAEMPPSEAPAIDAPDPGPLVVFLLIRALSIGGAERQVVELANRLAEAGLSIGMVTLYDKGGLEQEIDHHRIRLFSLAKRGRWDMLLPALRLLLLLRRERPAILYAFLPAQTTL